MNQKREPRIDFPDVSKFKYKSNEKKKKMGMALSLLIAFLSGMCLGQVTSFVESGDLTYLFVASFPLLYLIGCGIFYKVQSFIYRKEVL